MDAGNFLNVVEFYVMENEMNGWKLVPIEPTEEMIGRASTAEIERSTRRSYLAYKAMLAAAPEPSASVGMEPVAWMCVSYGSTSFTTNAQMGEVGWKVMGATSLYSAEQFATLNDDRLYQIGQVSKYVKELNAAEEQLATLQAKIDALMLEHCPDEMTETQVANWENHQIYWDAESAAKEMDLLQAKLEQEIADHRLTVDTYRNKIEPTHKQTLAKLEQSEKDAARWRFLIEYQEKKICDPSLRCDPIDSMWRSVFAEHRLHPSRAEYETSIDEAISKYEVKK